MEINRSSSSLDHQYYYQPPSILFSGRENQAEVLTGSFTLFGTREDSSQDEGARTVYIFLKTAIVWII